MSEAKPHPISLQQMFFTRCEVVAVPNHEPGPDVAIGGPPNDLKVAKIEGEIGRYTAYMSTSINPEGDSSQPYRIRVECLANFFCDETLDEKEAKRGVLITANSVLYGAIRETVAWLTGRQPYGPLMLGLSVLQTAPPPADTPPTE